MKKILSLIAGCLLFANAQAFVFNEWYADGGSCSLTTNPDATALYTVFSTPGNPWDAQFCNVFRGVTGQNYGNQFTLSFDVKWLSSDGYDTSRMF